MPRFVACAPAFLPRAFLSQVKVELVKKSTFQLGYDGSALTQAQLQAIVEESACGSPVSAGCSATLTLRPQRRRALSGTPTYDVQMQQQMSGGDSVQADLGAADATVANIASSIQAQDGSAQVVAEVQAVSTEAEVVKCSSRGSLAPEGRPKHRSKAYLVLPGLPKR